MYFGKTGLVMIYTVLERVDIHIFLIELGQSPDSLEQTSQHAEAQALNPDAVKHWVYLVRN